METKDKMCPICDGSFDSDKSLFVCEDHEEVLDSWIVTLCDFHDPPKPTISKYKRICMPCMMTDNNEDWRSQLPVGSHTRSVAERSCLQRIGQAGSDELNVDEFLTSKKGD